MLKPVIGARCATYFKQTRDFFGDGRQAHGWYPATIERVNGSKITARFDDNTKEENLSVSEIRLLRQEGNKLYWKNDNGQDEVFCENRPEQLSPGDLVMAFYQCGGDDAWYRGRVAVTGRTEDGTKVCDVAYDDGDYEMDIPYGAEYSNIMVLQRGSNHREWLTGLTINYPFKKYKTGVVLSALPKEAVRIQYKGKNGNESFERIVPYLRVATIALANVKNGVADGRKFRWPWHGYAVTVDEVPSPAKKAKSSKTRKSAKTMPQRKLTMPLGWKYDESSVEDDEEETTKKAAPKGKKTTSKKKKAPTKKAPAEQAEESSDDEEIVEETVSTLRRSNGSYKQMGC
jgi:hypothetical protein